MIHAKARKQGLFTEQIGNELVVYDQVKKVAHRLNPTLALVWKNCDGSNSVADIAAILKKELNEVADENLVTVSLSQLDSAHLLEESIKLSAMETRASRREFVRKVGAVGVMSLLLPLLTTMAVPTPAQAATCQGSCGSCGTCAGSCGTCTCCSTCAGTCTGSCTGTCSCSCTCGCTGSGCGCACGCGCGCGSA
jgi:Coenzyme PQQ synthesis protein D (PqqD)